MACSNSRSAARDLIAVSALLCMVLIFFGPLLLTGRIPLLGDLCNLFLPGYLFIRESLLSGALPLWNPYTGCGEPFLADIERGVFYPVNAIYLVLPATVGIVIAAMVHVLLAGVGTYALARAWRVSRTGALLSGVVYAFNAYTITKVAFPSTLGSAAWLPIVLWGFVVWLRRRTRRAVMLTAIALTLQLLSGYAQAVTFTVIALFLLAITAGVVAGWRRRTFASFASPAGGLACVGVLAVLLSMAQLLPTLAIMAGSARGEAVNPQLELSSVHPMAIFTLLIPSAYGIDGPAGVKFWAPSSAHYSLTAFYIGLLPLAVLLTAGLHWLLGRREAEGLADEQDTATRVRVPFLIGLFAFFYLYAMGRYTPLYDLLRNVVPLLDRFKWPTESLLCVVLSWGCLAGIGLDTIASSGGPHWRVLPQWRSALARWGVAAAFFIVAVLSIGCLVDGGRLGEWILERFFNLSSIEPQHRHAVPWETLTHECVKLAIVGPVAALLLQAYSFAPRARRFLAALIIAVCFGDLADANAYLLHPGPSAVVEGPSAYVNDLREPDRITRCVSFRNIFYDNIQRQIAVLSKDMKVHALPVTWAGKNASGVPNHPFRFWRDILYVSWPAVDKVFTTVEAGNFPSARVLWLLEVVGSRAVPDAARRRVLAMLNCDRVLMTPRLRDAFAFENPAPAKVARLEDPLPRAYVVGGLDVLPDRDAVRRAIVGRTFDPRQVALARRDAVEGIDVEGLRPGRVQHAIKRLEYVPNGIEIELECASAGLLVVSEAYVPGWQAEVNGRSIEVTEVNHGLLGLRVPAGRCAVVLSYRPWSVPIGIAVSIGSFVVVVILLLSGPGRPGANASGQDADSRNRSR